ncbi:MAG: D-alanine--D-alanine ligase [Acidaminococcaceae bacterium]|jgi:D-alanine-D-alanine ligase|nr:D-alanine--D-alanine ligase [Acidaminococcaceae bacterium]
MKQTVLVIFGGASTEHEISCQSAINVIENINSNKYNVILVGITKEGEWLLVKDISLIMNKKWYESRIKALLLPDAKMKSLLVEGTDNKHSFYKIDVIFPVLHGKNGEDGTIQGLFEMAKIPYVGSGVLASAVAMDKVYTKIICQTFLTAMGIKQAKYVSFVSKQWENQDYCIKFVEERLSYPVFVKPANAGSSCGITKAHSRAELIKGINLAWKVDGKIIVEETIVGRELECAVFCDKDGEVKASDIGEIKTSSGFYDYDAKYNDPCSETIVQTKLSRENAEIIRTAAKAIFTALGGFSLARVDFFLTKEDVVFNEINTMPGFTAISMYPMLWEAKGMSKPQLIQNLLDTGFSR